MKELLGSCTDQLKQFEDLNQLRNDVIEKLEKENAQMRHQLKVNGLQARNEGSQQRQNN